LPGFGKLVKQKRKARTGFNPKTQQKIKIPAKTVVKFRVAKGLLIRSEVRYDRSLTDRFKPFQQNTSRDNYSVSYRKGIASPTFKNRGCSIITQPVFSVSVAQATTLPRRCKLKSKIS
jgi:Bacterial DNA-binding protein